MKENMRIIHSIVIVILLGISPMINSQSSGFEQLKNLELIDYIYMKLDKYYVDEPKIGEISKAGIDAMLRELDPYTVYYHESNIEDYRLMTTGQYGGIGALIRKIDDYVVIAEPYEGMPADKAGLQAGDKILTIDGKSMKGMETDIVSEALKGPKGSKFTIEIERPFGKSSKKITIERDEIKLPDVPYSGMIDETNKIGYIKLNSFTQTASRSVRSSFEELKEQGMDKLILDLRGNGGGLLIESVNIVNFFVPQNTEIVTTKGKIIEENRSYKTQFQPVDLDIPIVVLVDGASASASEIVSGSLQDLDRAVVVGNTTFGKGLVQRTVDLIYGAKMKLTIAKYYTPSGRCVQKLDYYHKNDGKVDEVPDSLITVFHTKNGREVIDGRGIEPDVTVELDDLARLTVMLITNNIFFNYATEFKHKNPTIASAEKFVITDAMYKDFVSYVKGHDFKYKTAAEEQLEKTLEVAKKEGYDKIMDKEYEALHKILGASKEKDLELYKEQIKRLLAAEIVTRYHYQKGHAINSFQEDDALMEGIKILKDKKRYNSILKK